VAITFSPVELTDSSLFGIRLEGSVGRSDRRRLQDLTTKCLSHGKNKLILDLGGLESLGGGGAAELAALQRKVTDRDGEVVFVGATKTVHRFLVRSFNDLPLRIFPSTVEAESGYHDGTDPALTVPEVDKTNPLESDSPDSEDSDDPAVVRADHQDEAEGGMGAVCLSPESDETPDSSLDDILGAIPSNQAENEAPPVGKEEPSPSKQKKFAEHEADEGKKQKSSPAKTPKEKKSAHDARRADSPSSEPAKPNVRGAARHQYISLADAMASIKEVADDQDLGEHLQNLLHSHDLADTVVYCCRSDERFVDAAGQLEFAVESKLAQEIAEAERPLSLLDIPGDELAETEAKFLAEVSPDLILPVFSDGELQAVAFLQRGKQDHEYSVSENFALEILMRLLAEFGDRSHGAATEKQLLSELHDTNPTTETDEVVAETDAVVAETNADQQIRNAYAILATAMELTTAADEGGFWELLQGRLGADLGIKNFLLVDVDSSKFEPVVVLGMAETKVAKLETATASSRKYLQGLECPVARENVPTSFKKLQSTLEKVGIDWIVPLKTDSESLGIILLGGPTDKKKAPVDIEYLFQLFPQVTTLLQRLRTKQEIDHHNLELVLMLISLMEERHYGPGGLSGELTRLVRKVAREVGFPPDQERDLVYGALLRDIGMFPTGDLTVDSFGNMSEEQWQQFRAHPEEGVRRLEGLSVSEMVKAIVLSHHERFNGEGYPQGLTGEDIPQAARIVAIVENYVAMVTTMPNRPALTQAQAVEIISENFGERYDPNLAEVFVRVIEKEQKEATKHAVLTKS